MAKNIEVLIHSSIKINGENVIYIDPFNVDKKYNDADFIFITHNHYDHYSKQDIDKVKTNNTVYIVPKMMGTDLLNEGVLKNNIVLIEPNNTYDINGIHFETIPAYNTNKQFHPKENGWVGYVIEQNGLRYYIAGDTDITEENKRVKCDIALVPVGGTYTMNARESAELINIIKPKIAVPTHYGDIVGTKQDAEKFIELLDSSIIGKIGYVTLEY